ncbi:MAG: hypothetical protein LUI05_02825 [Oscillospiraceae bacterium]|nr:hypothetical protein [Oscillospiraceae bacterium]
MEEHIVFDQTDVEKNKTNAILMTVFPILFFLPLVSADMKSSAYLRFFSNQCLVLIIANIVLNILGKILGLIPLVGWILRWALSILLLVLYIMNIVNAAGGKGKKLPLIGGITIIK